MNMLLFVVSFSALIYSANSQYRFDCFENYCSTPGHECPTFSCEGGRTVENATRCGCCSLCIKTLKGDDECVTTYYKWSEKIAECGFGLICKRVSGKKGKCVPNECLKRLRKYEKSTKEEPLLKPTFGCDYFGTFEPSQNDSSKPQVVCINDVLCFCVNKHGKRIFGTDFARHNSSLTDMNCDCSLDIHDFPKAVDYEYFPRCLPNGDYDPLQCAGDKCFCMESAQYPNDKTDIENIERLPCFNDNRRPEQNRITKCLKKRQEEIEEFKNLTVIGDLTRCELDGTYYPLQCKEGRCFCAKRNGEEHIGFGVNKKEGELKCRCLRDKEIIESYKDGKTDKMKIFLTIDCDGKYTSNTSIISKTFINDFMKD